jgi:magnesium chelatase family protein
VLFLDEFAEMGTKNLEALRQPLADRIITISRASASLTIPANFILIAAMIFSWQC